MGLGSCLDYKTSMRVMKSVYEGGAEQAESSSSTNETERKWQDQVDGLSDKWRKRVKKAVHFGGVRRIPEKHEEGEESEEKTVTTLSLSVQVPTAGGKTGENGGERAVVYVTVVGKAKTSCGSVCGSKS